MTVLLADYPVEILEGKKNIECRQMGVNKGDIVNNIIQGNSESEFDFFLCCGDDRTDEDV
jgi:trehalose-phosphatase